MASSYVPAAAIPNCGSKDCAYHSHQQPIRVLNRRGEGGPWARVRLRLNHDEAQDAPRGEAPAPAIAEFFKKYEFQQFTYSPSNPADVEFQRLCKQRQWGRARIAQVRLEYDLAQQKSVLWQQQWRLLARSAMIEFFKNFEFDNFTYDISADPIEELKRLVAAQDQSQHKQTRAPAIVQFFKKYEYQQFTYCPSNPTPVEFKRLCQQRGWGPAKLHEVWIEFNHAQMRSAIWQQQWMPLARSTVVEFFENYEFHKIIPDSADAFEQLQRFKAAQEEAQIARTKLLAVLEDDTKSRAVVPCGAVSLLELVEKLPAVEFLKAQRVEGYNYETDPLHEEFGKLVRAKSAEWMASQPVSSFRTVIISPSEAIRVPSQATEATWKKIEAVLEQEFQSAVGREFNELMDFIGRSTGLEAWQVVAKLYGVGEAAMVREDAQQALESVHVNIFDFIEVIKCALDFLSEDSKGSLIDLLARPLQTLKFRDDRMLGFYSMYTGRVFDRNNAKENFTLSLLLRRISRYWLNFSYLKARFESEVGLELVVAEILGPHAIRELLLSRQWSFLRQ
ncbi:hypothetical protein L873DRAFT_1793062 [Choiromyces venosus 120613-1]|uniref:Uncharacterized protein n=1 Tax=Choiromyces venosus 120613-1 TaxID=1336337 RepID=A0A3N4JCW7_9PEZI|nr:hypothetical protein L873DRAFT_1793062 [Choiromyces venosus 120613-1]